jgi:hypothetical protein
MVQDNGQLSIDTGTQTIRFGQKGDLIVRSNDEENSIKVISATDIKIIQPNPSPFTIKAVDKTLFQEGEVHTLIPNTLAKTFTLVREDDNGAIKGSTTLSTDREIKEALSKYGISWYGWSKPMGEGVSASNFQVSYQTENNNLQCNYGASCVLTAAMEKEVKQSIRTTNMYTQYVPDYNYVVTTATNKNGNVVTLTDYPTYANYVLPNVPYSRNQKSALNTNPTIIPPVATTPAAPVAENAPSQQANSGTSTTEGSNPITRLFKWLFG